MTYLADRTPADESHEHGIESIQFHHWVDEGPLGARLTSADFHAPAGSPSDGPLARRIIAGPGFEFEPVTSAHQMPFSRRVLLNDPGRTVTTLDDEMSDLARLRMRLINMPAGDLGIDEDWVRVA